VAGLAYQYPAVMPAASAKDVVTAIGDLAQLLDGFIKAAAFGGVPHGGAVQSAVEQLILGAHTSGIECKFDYV
jgi:hypothetical protein